MSGPVVQGGGLVVEARRVVDVGDGATLRRSYPEAQVTELGQAIILPGLINSHVHLDLTNLGTEIQNPKSKIQNGPHLNPLRGSRQIPSLPPEYREREPERAFVGWVEEVIARSAGRSLEFWEESVLAGAEQCRRFGVTTVVDISGRFPGDVRRAVGAQLSRQLRWISCGEVTAMAKRRDLLDERIATALDDGGVDRAVEIGISPHAPYSIEPHGYRRCLEIARRGAMTICTHLAEMREEAEFLASHTGPLRELWTFLDAWDERVPRFEGGPIRFAQSVGLLDYPTLLAHVNYCDDEEMAILSRGKASIVYCPRTHEYFGHPPHRWREMLAAGINVVLGTDSCASSPDLNLVDDLRLVHRIAPEVEVHRLWEMATIRAGRAIGDETIGSLPPGKRAEFIVFEVKTGEPLREILELPLQPLGH